VHAWFVTKWNAPLDADQMPPIDAKFVTFDHGIPKQSRSTTENAPLQAYLYSLTMPGVNHTIQFGTDAEDICIDTSASECISRIRKNFITLHPVRNLAVKGIGSELDDVG
jgi:hypothetical protein